MNFIFKAVKWIANVVMAIVLIFGLIDSFGMKFVDNMIPTGPDDLGSLQITVKAVETTPQGFVLSAEEYPTHFVVQLIPPPDSFKALVQAGHKVDLAVKKEAVGNPKAVPVLQAYSLTLENGQKVFDTSQTIIKIPANATELATGVFHKMILVPVIYFVVIGFFPLIRRKLAKRA